MWRLVFMAPLATMGCHSSPHTVRIDRGSSVRPDLHRSDLLALSVRQLKSIKASGASEVVMSYSTFIKDDRPFLLLNGKSHRYAVTGGELFDISARTIKRVNIPKLDISIKSPVSLFSDDDKIAYVLSRSKVRINGRDLKVSDAQGVYSHPNTGNVYIATPSSLLVCDGRKKAVIKTLKVNEAVNVALSERGNEVAFSYESNRVSVFDRWLSKERFHLSFGSDQAIWGIDLSDDRLVVVTWEGVAFSAKWIARFFDLRKRKEIKSVAFGEPIECFILKGGKVAVVGSERISWEVWPK